MAWGFLTSGSTVSFSPLHRKYTVVVAFSHSCVLKISIDLSDTIAPNVNPAQMQTTTVSYLLTQPVHTNRQRFHIITQIEKSGIDEEKEKRLVRERN